MKRAALAANVSFLLVLGGYILSVGELSVNTLELWLLLFAVISPVASILVLLPAGGVGLRMRLGVGLANLALLSTLFVYVTEHKPLIGFDLAADWPVALLLTAMLVAPTLSAVAVIVMRPVGKCRSVSADGAVSKS